MPNKKYFIEIGQKFGRYTVRSIIPSYCICECECGNVRKVKRDSLATGATKSCGCLQKQIASKRLFKHGYAGAYSSEYRAWHHMKERCYNPKNKRYVDYGGRGITVCEDWRNSFEKFLKDVGVKPSKIHSLDRRDNDGNYNKDNCRWATPVEQIYNRRNTIKIEHEGGSYTLKQMAVKLNKSESFIRSRYVRGNAERKSPNLDIILRLLREGGKSMKQLRQLSGLSGDAVSNVLQPLKRKGVIIKENKEWRIV